jgi:hypothetical protein
MLKLTLEAELGWVKFDGHRGHRVGRVRDRPDKMTLCISRHWFIVQAKMRKQSLWCAGGICR